MIYDIYFFFFFEICRWARHFKSGQPIPAGLCEEVLKTRQRFGALDIQQQILYSAVDQFVFGPELGDHTDRSHSEVVICIKQIN